MSVGVDVSVVRAQRGSRRLTCVRVLLNVRGRATAVREFNDSWSSDRLAM